MMQMGEKGILITLCVVYTSACSLLLKPLEPVPEADSGPDSLTVTDSDMIGDGEADSGEDADDLVDSDVDEEHDMELQPCVESWTPESCGSATSRCDEWWNRDYARRRPIRVHGGAARGFPVLLQFDSSTTPTAMELYEASESANPGDDLCIVHSGERQLHRYVEEFSSSSIRIWFSLRAHLGSYRSVIASEQDGAVADSSSTVSGTWESVHDGSWLEGIFGEYGTDPWVIFDISGSAIPLYKVRIKNAMTNYGESERVTRFSVELSSSGLDPEDFVVVLDEAVIESEYYRRFHDFTFEPIEAEFVKLVLHDNFSGEFYHNIAVSELEAYEHSEDDSSYVLYYGNPDAPPPLSDLARVFPPQRDDDTWLLSYFEDGSDSVSDHSNNDRHGTAYNNPETVPGVFGRALQFRDNQGQFLEFDYSGVPCNSFTVEAFIDADAAGDCHRFAVSTGWRWALRWWDLLPTFTFYGDVWTSLAPRYVSSDRFVHYAMTYNGERMAFFIDGQLVDSHSVMLTSDCSEQCVYVAHPPNPDGSNCTFTSMSIDGLRISRVARTDFDYALPGNQVEVDVSCEQQL